MDLRGYQVEADSTCFNFFVQKKKPKPSLAVFPTAWGKSFLIGSLSSKIPGKTLVLQPSVELLNQNYEKFLLTGKKASIYSASKGIKEVGDITYATLGSIKNSTDFSEFRNLIIDEADRYSRSGDGMLQKFLKKTKITHILGVTATPLKLQTNSDWHTGEKYSMLKVLTDASKAGNFFKDVVYVAQIQEVVQKGFWAKLEYHTAKFDSSGLEYNTTKADYTEGSLKAAYDENDIAEKIIALIDQFPERKSILIAVPSVWDAQDLASKLVNAEAVWGDMEKQKREEVINDFKSQKLRIIVQVNVLTVGFDEPKIDMIIGGRPTASLAWYYQFLGRGVRPYIGKENTIVADLVGNFEKFGRIEELVFRKEKRETSNRTQWRLFGEGGKLLTGVPMHEIGKHFGNNKPVDDPLILPKGEYEGKSIMSVPVEYLQWMIKHFNFTQSTQHFKEIIKKRLNEQDTLIN